MKKIGLLSIILGFICLIIKSLTGSYLDESGILHELFFLLPIGFGLLFIGIVLVIIGIIKRK